MFFKTIIVLTICTLSFAFTLPEFYKAKIIQIVNDDENADNGDNELVPVILVFDEASDNIYRPPTISSNDDDEIPKEIKRFRRHSPNDDNKRGSVNVDVSRTQRGGTDLNVEGRTKLWESQNRQSEVNANAFYQRHYGGQSGTGRPNYGGGVVFTHRF